MKQDFNVWYALDDLELHAHDEGFTEHWRKFLRACAVLLLPKLPAEAQEWASLADEYESGRRTSAELTEGRVRALQFCKLRRDTSSEEELSGLRVVMYRLWPAEDRDDWHESAWHLVHFLEQAGLRQDQWLPYLQEQFPEIASS